ncbi:MAG: hypothetical protein V4726_00265 [Verrucomicrobiota bacterium]
MTLPDGSLGMHFIVKIPPKESISSARNFEKDAQAAAAQVGLALMEYGLAVFDTGGEPAELCGAVFSSKGRQPEAYQTSFGPITLSRHVYQSSKAGKTFAPFEERARIIGLSMPLFAAAVGAKYSETGGRAVQCDPAEHHVRPVSLDFIQKLAGEVASVALRREPYWRYETVTPPEQAPSSPWAMTAPARRPATRAGNRSWWAP